MAIYYSAIFASLRNKLANTVLYKRESDGIIRTCPDRIRNPRTAEQQTQRAKMALVTELSRRFAPIIREGFSGRAGKLTVYNAFVQANMPNIQVDEQFRATIDFKTVVCSDGILNAPNVAVSGNDTQLTFQATAEEADGLSAQDDMIYVGVYESAVNASRIVKVGERSASGSATFNVPQGWKKETMHFYAFAVSKSKKRTSPTVYLTAA